MFRASDINLSQKVHQDGDCFWYETWCQDGSVKLTNSSRQSSFVFSSPDCASVPSIFMPQPHEKQPEDPVESNHLMSQIPTFVIGAPEDPSTDNCSPVPEINPNIVTSQVVIEKLDENHVPKTMKVGVGDLMKTVSATELACHVNNAAQLSAKTSNIEMESKILVLYTGGTIGMKNHDGYYEPEANYLPKAIYEIPHLNDKGYVEEHYGLSKVKPFALPPVRHMNKRCVYWVVEYEPLLDSSDMTFDDWIRIAKDVKKSYHNYDGFVILHGTDTLAYTACALSFMMENLGKPVVITGAQIPVAEVRSDGRENLIGALIVAGNLDIPEVLVYFNNKLLRGNRSTKLDNSGMEAFTSPNMPPIAEMNIDIKVHYESVFRSPHVAPFNVHEGLCRQINLLRIFPSISIESIKAALQPPVRGIVLQTFGAGNMPSRRLDIIEEFQKANDRGCIILNVSQCYKGQVDANYLTGKVLYDVGVIPGSDMTTEAALTKLAYVLSKDEWDLPQKRRQLQKNIRGELTMSTAGGLHELDILTRLTKFLRISSTQESDLLRNSLLPPLTSYAAFTNDTKLLENLHEAGANFAATDYNHQTGLHVACSQGNFEAVDYMIKCGANVHLRDVHEDNSVIAAVRGKNMLVIKLLRKVGAVLPTNRLKIGIEICIAASRGDLETLKLWHAAGAKMTEKDYGGRTALDIARKNENLEIEKYLIEITMMEYDNE